MIFASLASAMVTLMWKIHLHVRMSLVSVKCVYDTLMEIIVRDVRTGIMEMPSNEKIAKVFKVKQYSVKYNVELFIQVFLHDFV